MRSAFSVIKKLVKNLYKTAPEKENSKRESRLPEMARKDNKDLDNRLALVKETLGESSDIIIRKFSSGNNKVQMAVIFIDGLADKNMISSSIITPIQSDLLLRPHLKILTSGNALELIQEHIAPVGEMSTVPDLTQAIKSVLSGDTALLVDGEEKVLVLGTRQWQMRTVSEPETEAAVRGPREGFTETMRVNTSLLRRRIRHEKLRFETMKAGRRTGTDIVLAYIEDIVNPRVLEEVRRRIAAIDTDSILESGYIEEFIEDSPFSVFPQIEHTERVDKASAAILEGRVVIITDNTPFVLVVPTTFFQFVQASEDYYERIYVAFALRMLRLLALNVALMLPAVYVAVSTFHQEMLPTPLLLSIAASREGIPFPAVFEALVMEGTFEVLREAGVRLPKTVGQAVSIVGGLVIGDAAIRAGIVSPAMVIIVAATAISTFAIPAFNASVALRLLRFPLIILGAVMGLYGVIFGLIIILIHLAGLQSFGVPYLSPLVHGSLSDMIKAFFRPPWWYNSRRPALIGPRDTVRQAKNMRPGPTPPSERELVHYDREDNNSGGEQDAGER